MPDGPGEAAPGQSPHPCEVHHNDPGIEPHPGGAEARERLHHTVHVLHRRHPRDLVRREQSKKNRENVLETHKSG